MSGQKCAHAHSHKHITYKHHTHHTPHATRHTPCNTHHTPQATNQNTTHAPRAHTKYTHAPYYTTQDKITHHTTLCKTAIRKHTAKQQQQQQQQQQLVHVTTHRDRCTKCVTLCKAPNLFVMALQWWAVQELMTYKERFCTSPHNRVRLLIHRTWDTNDQLGFPQLADTGSMRPIRNECPVLAHDDTWSPCRNMLRPHTRRRLARHSAPCSAPWVWICSSSGSRLIWFPDAVVDVLFNPDEKNIAYNIRKPYQSRPTSWMGSNTIDIILIDTPE